MAYVSQSRINARCSHRMAASEAKLQAGFPCWLGPGRSTKSSPKASARLFRSKHFAYTAIAALIRQGSGDYGKSTLPES